MKSKIFATLVTLALITVMAGCGGGSSGAAPMPPPPPPVPPPPPSMPMSAAGIWSGQAVTPDVADLVTSFEFDDTDGFVIGAAPFTATFQGGVTETRGDTALYASGVFSWHIDTAGASVNFATPGEALTFSTRTVSAGDNATIQILDDNGVEISLTPVSNSFQQIIINRGAGESLIGSIVVNVGNGEIVIDAFTFGYASTASTDAIACLFAPNDEFVCVVNDATTGELTASANGNFQVNGDQVSGVGNLYAAPGQLLLDGSTVAPLTISTGTVTEDTSLTLTLDNFGLSIAVTSLFDNSYDRGADLATVQAMYTMFELFGAMSSFNIDAAGVISGQSATGCVLSGQVSVIDAAANVYDVNLIADAATCGALSGSYDGLGTSQDENVADDSFVFAVFVDGQLMIVGQAIK